MTKQLKVGKWLAHAEVKEEKGDCGVVIVIPISPKGYAELCLESLGNGEKIVEGWEKDNG